MLSAPDFSEKQILMVSSGDWKNLQIKNGNLSVVEDGKILNQVSLKKIFAVYVVGNVTLTSSLISALVEEGAIILLSSSNYRPYCLIGGETEGNFLLREKQYRDSTTLAKARWVIANKIWNQISLLKNRRQKNATTKSALVQLLALREAGLAVESPQSLLGIEGNAAKLFFSTYFEQFDWHGRKPRTKYDELNTLLDIGYTYLFNFVEAHLRLYGFDIYRGFYHTDFYQRKSLVCDLVEPFRCIIDHALYRALALQQFDKQDFELRQGEYRLRKGCGGKYIQLFLASIMEHKMEIFLFLQSYYRAVLRDADAYPTFFIKK